MVSWGKALKTCYFLLILMIALAVAYPSLFNQVVFDVSLSGIYWALLVIIVGIAAYSVAQGYGHTILSARPKEKQKWWPGEQIISFISIAAVVFLAWLSYRDQNVFFTAIFVGGFGGLIHEIAQSNGKFMLPRRDANKNDDYIYLGGLFGLVAGGVAGLIFAEGQTVVGITTSLLSESFLAGLGLKGFADAVVTTKGTQDTQPLG